MHCYGRLESPQRAQRILWSLEYEDRPPINFIHIYDNHFVVLLPNNEDVTPNKKYIYYGYFMSNEDNVVSLNREIRPLNKIPASSTTDSDNPDLSVLLLVKNTHNIKKWELKPSNKLIYPVLLNGLSS